MFNKHRWYRLVVIALAFLVASATFSIAGTISLEWDPVPDADLDGYRVYYGTASGNYDHSTDVGNVTSYTLGNLADCTTWYVAVKAYDTEGLESIDFSAEISGWARPVVAGSSPNSGQQGADTTLTISGSNFQSGATLVFTEPGIAVNSVTVNSCSSLTANISIASSAALGSSDMQVINPDLVFGNGADMFTVVEAQVPASITSQPVDITVQEGQTATFSVSATGTGPLLYQWRRNGANISGADNPTYTSPPATPSDDGALFTCMVSNDAGSDLSDAARLTVEQIAPPIVVSTTPVNGATGVSLAIRPEVVFNVPIDPASIDSGTVQLLNASGNPVTQASLSPSLSGDGVTVTITPSQDLEYETSYRIRIVGGPAGVLTADGEPMDSDWIQPIGFTTEVNGSPGTVLNVERTDTRPATP